MKAVIIGAGNIAKTIHINAYQSEHIEISAISDIHVDVAKKVAEEFKIPNVYQDYQEMINIEKPDIVSVCTPNKFHFEQSIYAMEHHAHVFCEKPPATHFKDALTMHETALKNNVKLAFNFHHRYRGEVDAFVNWNLLNTPYFIEVNAIRRLGIPGWGVFTNRELQGGGALIDFGIHMLDLALYLLKNPKPKFLIANTYDAIGLKGGEGSFGSWDGQTFTVEDGCFAQIVFENNVSMQLKTTFALCTDKPELNIKMFAENSGITLIPLETHEGLNSDQLIEFEPHNFAQLALKTFIRHLLDESVLCRTLTDSVLLTQKLIEAIYISAKTQEPFYFE
ncbi:MAG TPA: gfo/Idh/MocA family oxidoreductase [Acholeplasmataceae bacterium]|nr:gfo/Idh/MocA family oxidoreductase [Acholeplasmataceae bacterium]